MTDADLRAWAGAHAAAGMPQARAVLALFARVAELEAALAPFADWYERFRGSEWTEGMVAEYRRAADALANVREG